MNQIDVQKTNVQEMKDMLNMNLIHLWMITLPKN